MEGERGKIFNFLRERGCCLTCCLRYLRGYGSAFLNVKESLIQMGIPDDSGREEILCPACLNLFTEKSLQAVIERIGREKEQFSKYDCRKIVTALSLPVGLDIRQLCLWIQLTREFEDSVKADEHPDTSVKDALRAILIPRLCDCLEATYDREGVSLNLTFNYPFESQEVLELEHIKPSIFQQIKGRKKMKTEVNRTAFEKHFLPMRLSREQCDNLLKIPGIYAKEASPAFLETLSLVGPTVFIAGRYQKFSRRVCQTPWILQNEISVLNSVQEIIVSSLNRHFAENQWQTDVDSFVRFSASGREDVDVRCVGRGRPFVIEASDSLRTKLPHDLAQRIEEEIAESGAVAVSDLQLVDRKQLTHLKEGEETKKKMYRALCLLEHPATVPVMQKLNIEEPFTVNQLTPLRVLHRRAFLKRPRVIYSVRAKVSKENTRLVVLDIQTQAGTYVKELVHGEFGRTEPSLASIVGQKMDILALDVTDIDIDWPKPVARGNP